MDLNATIDIILKDLNDIKEIIDDLKNYQGVPVIEIELAKSKCRSVIEIIALLKDTGIKPVFVREDHPVKKEEYPSEKKEKVEVTVVEPAPVETSGIGIQPTHQPEIQTEIIKEARIAAVPRSAEFTIIADQFSNRPESFNEKLSSMKHDDDVLEIIKTKPVSNLAEAIGINDKYLFIKEIFNGDQESYTQVLSKLESAGDLEEATAIILSYAAENKENEAFKMFINILKRKFPANE